MSNNFFKHNDKVYSENLNDGILIGNAFNFEVPVSLPDDTGGVFPNSGVVKAKVCDVTPTTNSNLSIGETVSNTSGSSQQYRLTVYPNFNRFGGFKSVSLDGDGTFFIANKGGSAPIVDNLDYDDLGDVPELKVLKEYDIVVSIPNNGVVTGLGFVFQSNSADVASTINMENVTGLDTRLTSIENKDIAQDLRLSALEGVDDGVFFYQMYAGGYNPSINSSVNIHCRCTDIEGVPVSGKSLTLYDNGTSVSASITNNVGVASWNVTLADWDNHHFTVANQGLDLKATGWKTIQSQSNYTILANGEFVRIDFKQSSNATVPQSYDYSLPSGYYPKYNVAAISSTIGSDGVHYAAFKADTSGNLNVILERNTYNSGVSVIYGQLIYPY